MLVSLQEAAGVLSTHHRVIEELWRRRDETLTDVEILAVISSTKPETTTAHVLGQLKRLRLLVEAEGEASSWELAAPLIRWIEYLQRVAQPVSSARVQGQLLELEHGLASFRNAELAGDVSTGREILRETRAGFQRLAEDLGQTRIAIAAAVSEAKGEHRKQGALERFRRINRLWNEYLLPMLDLLDPTGPLEALCLAWEASLTHAVENKFLPDRRAAERIETEMRVLRVSVRDQFRECQFELEPLHARLRRDSQWAEGAAKILKRLEDLGANRAGLEGCMSLSVFRFAGQMSTAALLASAASWRDISTPPTPIDFGSGAASADAQSVEDILAAVESLPASRFPITDLMGWLSQEQTERGFFPVLQAFSLLVTDDRYRAGFSLPTQDYTWAGGAVRCGRVTLKLRSKK
jgi:hypothetical protein